MSLFTPPSTVHRRKDKENYEIDTSSRVIFARDDKIHILVSSPSSIQKKVISSKGLPRKSILKKGDVFLGPFDEDPKREVTPEPSDPLVNLTYLEYPVSIITQPEDDMAKLRELIEAYSILTARLRVSVTGTTDIDASWPLFLPLRKNRDAFVNAVVRDLGKALIDPGVVEKKMSPLRVLLPSPKDTPKKKRDGMTAEQVKRARDLCTTSHAVIRLLSLVFTLPAIQSIFSEVQLRSMLTAVLAIPLAPDLPTLNARKTCALAIWLIQTQRLPVEVLAPAADRIAFALCRGIEGELGKEGKKGSASDGLKAVHDLSVHLPSIFIPAFTNTVLPSVLSSLLAPTLTLRTLACHALGGFALGCTEIPRSAVHTHISNIITQFMTTPPPPKTKPESQPSTSTSSPSKLGPSDPTIVRTLRTTLQMTEVTHVAHGPVWGISVLSSLIIMMGERVTRDVKVGRIVGPLAGLAMRHRRSSVRGLGCLMWRCIVWVLMQPRLMSLEDGDEDKADGEIQKEEEERERKMREHWWRLVTSVTELETGVCTIAALLGCVAGCEPCLMEEGEGGLRKAVEVLGLMVEKDPVTCRQAIDVLKQLVGMGSRASASSTTLDSCGKEESSRQTGKLIPRSLFSALPGLLSVDYKALSGTVNSIYLETPKAEDVRCLTREEVGRRHVWEGLVKVWRGCFNCEGVWEQRGEPDIWKDLVRIWEGLVGMRIAGLQDMGNEDHIYEFAMSAVDVIIDIVLQDPNLFPTLKNPRARAPVLDDSTIVNSGNALKLKFAKDLWRVMQKVFPHAYLCQAGERLLACLMKNAEEFTNFVGEPYNALDLIDNRGRGEKGNSDNEKHNERWAAFCVSVLAECGAEALRAFWGYPDAEGQKSWVWIWSLEERRSVWKVFCARWMELEEAEWEGGVGVLGVPFMYDNTWDLSKADAGIWQALLDHTIAKALDYGHDSSIVLSSLARTVAGTNQTSPTAAPSCMQLVEFLMTQLINEIADAREVPEAVLEFVNDTMQAAYPPSPREKMKYLWASRAVMEAVERCPGELVKELIGGLAEGLITWIEDETVAWSLEELEYDVVTLYQTILVRIQELPLEIDVLLNFGAIIGSPFSARDDVRMMASGAFKDFWEATYGNIGEPVHGWPEEIASSLAVVFGDQERRGSLVEVQPSTSLASAFFPTSPDPEIDSSVHTITRPSTPITPTASSQVSASTPPRPQKLSVNFFAQLPFNSPGSPVPISASPWISHPQTPQRTPIVARLTPRSAESPSKRRRKIGDYTDKENDSPVPPFDPRLVAERIEQAYASKTKSSTLGKRRSLDGGCDDGLSERPSPLKKGKKVVRRVEEESEEATFGRSDSHDADDVFVRQPTLESHPTFSFDPLVKEVVPPLWLPKVEVGRKRKGVFIDAVELPRLCDIYPRLRTASSFDSAKLALSTPKNSKSTRQTRSATKAATSSAMRNGSGHKDVESSSRKRRRASAGDVFSYSPIDLKSRSKLTVPPELSSDDDPHIGQVTPHHLISPELKRGRRGSEWFGHVDGGDPPSDDSVIVSSPSREMVERRMKRIGSLRAVTAVKVNRLVP